MEESKKSEGRGIHSTKHQQGAIETEKTPRGKIWEGMDAKLRHSHNHNEIKGA
jgi:hypothetical protein